MDDLITKFFGGLGFSGIIIAVILYFLDKFPSIISNLDNLANKNLKSLSDLSQSNYLKPNHSTFISNILSEIYIKRLFRKPISGYQIEKINYLYDKLNKKISLESIVFALDGLNLDQIDNTSRLLKFDLDQLLKLHKDKLNYFMWAEAIIMAGMAIYSILSAYKGVGEKFYNLANSWSFFFMYVLALTLLAFPFMYNYVKVRKLCKSIEMAYSVRDVLEIETNYS